MVCRLFLKLLEVVAIQLLRLKDGRLGASLGEEGEQSANTRVRLQMMKHLALQDTSLKGFFWGGFFAVNLPVAFTESKLNEEEP